MARLRDSEAWVPAPEDSRPLPAEAEAVAGLAGLAEEAEAFYVAPNWKLVWWRFKKHRLALVSGVIIFMVAIVALAPDFFSTQDPHETSATESFIPIQRVHFIDEGRISPLRRGGQAQSTNAADGMANR